MFLSSLLISFLESGESVFFTLSPDSETKSGEKVKNTLSPDPFEKGVQNQEKHFFSPDSKAKSGERIFLLILLRIRRIHKRIRRKTFLETNDDCQKCYCRAHVSAKHKPFQEGIFGTEQNSYG